MRSKRYIAAVLLSFFTSTLLAQSTFHVQNIGDFITSSKDTIKDCKIAYSTKGQINADSSNIVFMPTWHMGSSEGNLDYLGSIIDTSEFFIVVVDALGNGISSSPSNHENFPNITIRDMVESQHKLLLKYLGIDQVEMLIGVSMGGMQAFEWMIAYPEFMNRLVAINGTTKASFYDKGLWGLIITLIEDSMHDEEMLDYAMKRVSDLTLLAGTSPAFVTNTYDPEDYEKITNERYKTKSNPYDKLSQSRAIFEHDIYRTLDKGPGEIADLIKAELFVITAKYDHVVNPIYSYQLAEQIQCKLVELRGDCGHVAAFCDVELVKAAMTDFLEF